MIRKNDGCIAPFLFYIKERNDYEKKHSIKSHDLASDDMLPEYNFDYRKARPNRFAERVYKDRRVVILDPDISKVFTTSESVNAILRALIATMPKLEKTQQQDSSLAG